MSGLAFALLGTSLLMIADVWIVRLIVRQRDEARASLAVLRKVIDMARNTPAELAEGDTLAVNSRANRAAVRVLVEALPRCAECEDDNHVAPATVGTLGMMSFDGECSPRGSCDLHADLNPPRGYAPDADLTYAPALRALLARMKTWSTP